jgi:tetrahydrodipicolinate N-succinyltransferase
MAAMETFDWLKNEIWPQANDEIKKFLEERREYILQIRNENERRRLIDEIMTDVKVVMMRQKN